MQVLQVVILLEEARQVAPDRNTGFGKKTAIVCKQGSEACWAALSSKLFLSSAAGIYETQVDYTFTVSSALLNIFQSFCVEVKKIQNEKHRNF